MSLFVKPSESGRTSRDGQCLAARIPLEGTSALHLYVIAWRPEGPVKLGVARETGQRLADLQVGNPYRLSVAWSAEAGEPAPRIERAALYEFREARMCGEWVDVAADRAAAFMRLLLAAETGTVAGWDEAEIVASATPGMVAHVTGGKTGEFWSRMSPAEAIVKLARFSIVELEKSVGRRRRFTHGVGIPQQRQDEIIAAYTETDMHVRDIAAVFGCRREYVYRVLRDNGVPSNRKHPAPTPASPP